MIRGNHKYKVVWYNPLVGEDLLSESEVGNPHDMHAVLSHMARPCFPIFVWGRAPHKKTVGPGHTRLRNITLSTVT